MSERLPNDEHNLLPKAILAMLGSWIFAYYLSVVFSQIGLVLIHVIMGRTGNIIYLNPFEFYTDIPNPLSEPYLWIIGSNFLNMICATIVFFVIWKKQSHYLLPLRMWAPAVFIIEGIIIISQNIGFIYGNWTELAGLGVIFAIFLDIFSVSTGESSTLLAFLGSTGPWVLFIGIGIFLIVVVALFMIYFWKNGHYLILRLIGAIEKE